MKRFTITPQPKKSIKIPSSTIKPTAFPRMSLNNEDIKSNRNVRDKTYKQNCIDNISSFLNENNFEGLQNNKALTNPSNKDFQNIIKFIYSFIDATPFVKFEDDLINILKILKYPYSNEITRSQLSAVTPHTWPVLLSMISWIVDLIKKSDTEIKSNSTIETEFFDFVCEGYMKFMEGNEDDANIENDFISRVSGLHSQEIADIENRKNEISLFKEELENLENKFEDLEKLDNKKTKIEEDLNQLILQEKQLENKKNKYISSIEKLADEMISFDSEIEELLKIKNELIEQISLQTINPEDIKGMNIEKVELFKELERLKPERETRTKIFKELETKLMNKIEDNERCLNEILCFRRDILVEKDDLKQRTIDVKAILELENELSKKKESLVGFELNLSSLEEKLNDKTTYFKDLENQYNYYNSKLQTLGAIYLEKKEFSDRSQQKNRNEMDKLDNELLKLKLDSDSALLKSEKDCSEAKIKLDMIISNIEREKEEINKEIWKLYSNFEYSFKNLISIQTQVKKIINNS